LLYFPCISVTTAIAKESRHYWATFAVIWTTSLAYICSLIYYQLATNLIVLNLFGIVLCSLLYLGLLIFILRRQIKADRKKKLNFSIKII
jgi:ferrous iron transport protein B